MNLNLFQKDNLKKRCFTIKSAGDDRPLLTLYHQQFGKDVRITHAEFNNTGKLLAVVDLQGNVFVIDLHQSKCWGFQTHLEVSSLKFSEFTDEELFVGSCSGDVFIFQIYTSNSVGKLSGHTNIITNISFLSPLLCLTSSQTKSIVWDLKTFCKLDELSTKSMSSLKIVTVVPNKNLIAVHFSDDTLWIWSYPSLECVKKIKLTPSFKEKLRTICVTRNGSMMILAGYFAYLLVFSTEDFSSPFIVNLPNQIDTVKNMQFISQPFDGGTHKKAAILSGNGVIYFYDMETNNITGKIVGDLPIMRFRVSPIAEHLANISNDGCINIYKLKSYVSENKSVQNLKKHSKINSFETKVEKTDLQIKKSLSFEHLKTLLNFSGNFPKVYRIQIWLKLLKIPMNSKQFNDVINKIYQPCFPNLEKEFPMVDKRSLKNLRCLLSNLITWNPFLQKVSYLPYLVFPFVKIIANNPLVCFEIVASIIKNWCQYWFEFFPLDPVNIYGIIGNLLLEHDRDLATYLLSYLDPKVYIWPLLETSFSEVLTSDDWCYLWDHVITNQPYFYLFCIVAYSIVNREILLTKSSKEDFQYFYHSPSVIEIHKLISKAYQLMKNTSERNHPKNYLQDFSKLQYSDEIIVFKN